MAGREDFRQIAQERSAGWRRIAYLMCGDWARAEGLVQEALVRLYMHWHRLDLSGIDAYARKVITRLAIDDARRPHRRSEVSMTVHDLAARTSSAEDVMDVRTALQKVAPRQRAVLILRFYLELSVAEIAVLAKLPPLTQEQVTLIATNLSAELGRVLASPNTPPTS